MPVKILKDFLDKSNVKYVSVTHSKAFTSSEVAASAHVSGIEFAKTVMINVNGTMAMAVIPSSYQIDFELLKTALNNSNVRLASENEFKNRFPDCELGAMPPFGNLYNLPVYMAESLTKNIEISFNAGTHTELIRMKLHDYMRLVNPEILKFSIKYISFPSDPAY